MHKPAATRNFFEAVASQMERRLNTCRCGTVRSIVCDDEHMCLNERRCSSFPRAGGGCTITKLSIDDFGAVGACCVCEGSFIVACYNCGDRFRVSVMENSCFCRRVERPLESKDNLRPISEILPLQLRPYIQKTCVVEQEDKSDPDDADMNDVFAPKSVDDQCVGSFYDSVFSMEGVFAGPMRE